ncbi:MAG: hypothetical protein ACPGF7_07960 [Pontibacterium sp.]
MIDGPKNEMLLEIVELDNGDLAIRRIDEDDAPLMVVAFGDDLRDSLKEKCTEVGRMMLTAGIHMIAESGHRLSTAREEVSEQSPTLH